MCTEISINCSIIKGDLNYNIQTEMETRIAIVELRHLQIVWYGKTGSLSQWIAQPQWIHR